MHPIVNRIHIARPAERVFDFATTPGNWVPGERVDEEMRVAGHRNRAHWIVRERVAPLAGSSRDAGATEFVRELIYRMPNVLYRLMDWLFARRLIAVESARALANLKAVLEAE